MQDREFPPPIFVLAAPGLPNQTVAAALGRNPVAYDLPELNLELMPSVDALQLELSGLRTLQIHGLLRALAQLLSGEQTSASVEMAGRWLTRRAHLSTEVVAREIASLVAPRRLVAPVTAAMLDPAARDRLREAFPQAVFVHLQAHPRVHGELVSSSPEGESLLQLMGAIDETTDPATPDPQELWLMAETALARFLAQLPPDRLVRQKLEDLVADPAGALATLARALDLPSDEAALARMCRPELSVFAGPGPWGAHLPGQVRRLPELAAALPDRGSVRLGGPLPWRPDSAGFRAEVRRRAEELGYS